VCIASLSDAFHAASNAPSATQLSAASLRSDHQLAVRPACHARPLGMAPHVIFLVAVDIVRSSPGIDEVSVGRRSRFPGLQIGQFLGES
jgi:hypothetical protein